MATMSTRIKVLVYTDPTPTNNPKQKLIDIDETTSDTTVDQYQPLLIKIADATVDQAIALNGIVGEKLVLTSDQTISIKLNGSGTAIQTTLLVLDGANITSLSVSNASGAEANVTLGIGK